MTEGLKNSISSGCLYQKFNPLSYIVVEKGKIYPYAETGNTPFNPLSQPCSVVLRGIAHKIEVEAKEEYISTSPLVFR